MEYTSQTEQWNVFEIKLESSRDFVNPFTEVRLQAYFQKDQQRKRVLGFYDGGSSWKIRFMPEETGTYHFKISSNHEQFNGLEGTFECSPAQEGNHGPVRVNGKHFNYEDGTPFFVMGTTAYAWTYRPEEIRKQTLESFSKYGFNKIRMLVFPKYMAGEDVVVDVSYDPPVFPFAGVSNEFDFQMLLPEYFQNYESRVKELLELGIEADVILFHPYDCWGIDQGMQQEDNLLYVQYMVARLSAFRNVWWSLGNEYNISQTIDGKFRVGMDRKDWDLVGAFIKANDPHKHLISNHNIPFGDPLGGIYPDRDWLTHVSYQHPDTYTLMLELQRTYNKPVINDEYQYEGNIKYDWGNSDAKTTVFRHWLSVMAGGYASHGEVYEVNGNNKDLFWSYGGTFTGESAPRLKFMKQILESLPYQDMERSHLTEGHHYFALQKGSDEYLFFCRYEMIKQLWFGPYDGTDPEYEATAYDVWNCEMIEKKTIKQSDMFPIKEWTVVHLKKIP